MIQQWPVTTAVYIVCEDDIYWTQGDAVERGKDSEQVPFMEAEDVEKERLGKQVLERSK